MRFLTMLLTLALTAALGAQAPAPVAAPDLAGLRFRGIGPATMSGRVVDMDVVESNSYVWYVASSTGGVWRTRDNGITWAPVFEREAVHSVGDIAVFQPDPRIIWVGTGERANRQSVGWGDGVYRSTDEGKTWTNVGLRDSKHIGRIQLHPSNPDVAYVAAQGSVWGPGGDRGVFKTADGGRTWQRVLHVDDDTGATDVAMDWHDPKVLYAATYQRRRSAFGFHGGGPGSALWKSTDAGSTWTKLTGSGLPDGNYGRIGIAVYRKDPRILYVSIEQGARYNASTAYTTRKAGLYRSDDRGATWTYQSDWNPRPMYASQPTVDPQDDQRIYMLNSYSFSDDAGKTFTSPRHTTHGDDRFVWINPRDSRHVVKLDDGGIGISYDRGLKFLYVSSLPLSQFYRVAVDNAVPYNVYGGLQDNGCWKGPSASWTSNGILNEHWQRLCGGDGFFVVPDPDDPRVLYSASQFLGIQRNDTVTYETQDLRPGDPTGHIGGRRNLDTWGKDLPDPPLGNAMHPANWDAPIIISPHDSRTVYAGARHLFRTRDRGLTWEDLGDMTTGVDRSELMLMGQRPDPETVASLDDGVPYFPGITALAESPRRKGVLYVGSDDGRFRISMDDGRTWADAQARFPGLPRDSWFAGVEPSRHDDGTVYVAVDNHRSNDFANYVYKSTDFGQTWRAIAGGLPANRVARTIREDPRNPRVLYLGTELGLFVTLDGGGAWLPLRNNMPTLAFNDLAVQARDNDLVLGSHGRGIWILDNLNAIQELTPEIAARPAHLFSIEPAHQIRYTNLKAHAGDMIFRGENPPAGGIIDFWSAAEGGEIALSVRDASGRPVATLSPRRVQRGINRIVWNLRHDDISLGGGAGGGDDDEDAPRARSLPGPLVTPGTYTVVLTSGGVSSSQMIDVREDPRVVISPSDRTAWTAFLLDLAAVARDASKVHARVMQMTGADAATRDQKRQANELLTRISGLYRDAASWTGLPTADQRSQLAFYRQEVVRLGR